MADQDRPMPAAAPKTPVRRTSSSRKISRRLVVTSSAAVLAIYAVGYIRTKPAADRIAAAASQFQSSQSAAPSAATGQSTSVSVALTVPTVQSPASTVPVPTSPSPATTTDDSNGGGSTGDDGNSIVATNPTVASSPTSSNAAPTTVVTAPPAPTATPVAAASKYKDGTYTGTGTSRHGDISAQVLVKSGKIVSAQITACYTRYPCSRISDLPGEVISQQTTNVDMVSGATDSSEAYLQAVDNALQNAT